jgi:HD-GYP domain-containing protein (c-di-GMP phosphodiesterase class II)
VTSLRSGAAGRSALAKPSAAEGLPGLVETGDPQRLAEAAGLLGSQEGSGADEPQRVRQYVGLLADKLGMPPERSEILCTAAAIHDIGKLIIPEFEVVKAHSTLGGSLLAESGSEVLSLAATIAWTHHERWDGNGYPRGLAGEEIPLEGRIVAIADVFDALISPRSYRPALTIDDAVRVLEEGRGSQFDPQILDLFLKSLDEVVEIAQDRSTK